MLLAGVMSIGAQVKATSVVKQLTKQWLSPYKDRSSLVKDVPGSPEHFIIHQIARLFLNPFLALLYKLV